MVDKKSVEYIETKKPKFSPGGFDVYYDENDFRPDRQLSAHWFFKDFEGKISKYQNYCEYSVDELRPNSMYKFLNQNDVRPEVFAIKCPNCGCRGQIKGGWRVKCKRCFTWLEADAINNPAKISVWRNNLNTKMENGRIKYYHHATEITEQEYLYWRVYYKLA
jgi:hypothetical protein